MAKRIATVLYFVAVGLFITRIGMALSSGTRLGPWDIFPGTVATIVLGAALFLSRRSKD